MEIFPRLPLEIHLESTATSCNRHGSRHGGTPEPALVFRMSVSGKKTQVRVWIFPGMQILEFSKQRSGVYTGGEPPFRSRRSRHCYQLLRIVEKFFEN